MSTPGERHDDTEEPEEASVLPTDGTQGVLTGQVPVDRPVPPDCPDHREINHHDGKPSWCDTCGWARRVPLLGAIYLRPK